MSSTIAALDAPTHDDVLEVRLHSARVAAELARVTVELRAEIEHARTVGTATLRTGTSAVDNVVDLSDRADTR